MLVCRGHDLVVRAEAEAGEHDVAPVGRRRRERQLGRIGADQAGDRRPSLLAQLERALEVGHARAALVVSRSSSSRIASAVGVASGPNVPALR